jgi:hypothetical protein
LNEIEAKTHDASTLFHFIDGRMFEMVAHQRLHALKFSSAEIGLLLCLCLWSDWLLFEWVDTQDLGALVFSNTA